MAGGTQVQLLIFSQQFASMLQSKLQLVDVLDNLARETPQRKLRDIIEDISEKVRHGVDLGDALAAHPNMFGEIYVNVIRAGLASGRLGDAAAQVADYLSVINEVGRKVRGALAYPFFMIGAFLLVFNGMVFFILPRFSRMFQSFGKELPWATRVLMEIGDLWANYWYAIIGTIVTVTIAFAIWISSADGRYIWDRIKLRVPIVGPLWRMAALSRFLRTLAVQLQNEVLLLEAIEVSAQASGNVYVRDSLYDIHDDVQRGNGLAGSFRRYDIFEGIVLQMIAAGEEAGTLDELLMSAADYFERLLYARLDTVTGLINPILTVLIGLVIAGMMIASFLPVFQIGSVV
tara:strand:- start:110 stop:1147 length:1038 start_codon:yes stop_codon:yes gene_type:complete